MAPKKAKASAKEAKPAAIPVPVGPVPISDTPRAEPVDGGLRMVAWNVGGLNGLLKSAERSALLRRLVEEEDPDLLSLSEHKLSADTLPAAEAAILEMLPGYKAHWAMCTVKKGYRCARGGSSTGRAGRAGYWMGWEDRAPAHARRPTAPRVLRAAAWWCSSRRASTLCASSSILLASSTRGARSRSSWTCAT